MGGRRTNPARAPPSEHDHGDAGGGEPAGVRGEDGGVGGGVGAAGRVVGGREAVRRRVPAAHGGVLRVDGGDPVRLNLFTKTVSRRRCHGACIRPSGVTSRWVIQAGHGVGQNTVYWNRHLISSIAESRKREGGRMGGGMVGRGRER
jgi:hypothetical protein